jgi:hypothetical protein
MAESPEENTATPQPNEELVKVFDTEQESEAMVVRGLLESAGIPAVIQNLDAPQDVLPGVGGVIVLVREEQADIAKDLITDSRKNAALDEDTAVSEEPA